MDPYQKRYLYFNTFVSPSHQIYLSRLAIVVYTPLVRPHVEYAASRPIWDPYHVGYITRIQNFALRMCCKEWDT